MTTKSNKSIFNKKLLARAAKDSFLKLNPTVLVKNPVIFIVGIGAVLTSSIVLIGIFQNAYSSFNLQIAIWLWFTVLFANFSEAIAEGRGKAQAEKGVLHPRRLVPEVRGRARAGRV